MFGADFRTAVSNLQQKDRTIRKQNVFFVLICDFFYALFLLTGYRINLELVLYHQNTLPNDEDPFVFYRDSYVSTATGAIAVYFLFKASCACAVFCFFFVFVQHGSPELI